VFYPQNALFRFVASPVFDQCVQGARMRDKGIDQLAVERMGHGAKAFQSNAIFGLSLFQLQRELTACSQPASELAGRNPQGLTDSAYPSLCRTGDFARSTVGLKPAVELVEQEVSELAAHGCLQTMVTI
jgi:hypothetical protein